MKRADAATRHAQILKIIRDSMRVRGYPPTIKEIASELGFSSTASVHYHLRMLQRDGLIVRPTDGSSRLVVRTPPDVVLEAAQTVLAALDKGLPRTARQLLAELIEDLGGEVPAPVIPIYPDSKTAVPDAPGTATDHPKEITRNERYRDNPHRHTASTSRRTPQ